MAFVPYLLGVSSFEEFVPDRAQFPFNLPFLAGRFQLTFDNPVTFFVGENGTGKSTLIEALADLAYLPVSGGGRNELAGHHEPEEQSPLARRLRPNFRYRPLDGYFYRADSGAHFASLLDDRAADPGFEGDPYKRYGGKSLHQRSHGEAFLALIQNRMDSGLYLMDEPEAALSPQRQLSLLALMAQLAASNETQFIIATHSPILLTYPGAAIISFDHGKLHPVSIEETSHYQITKGILDCPQRYWKHLKEP